MLHLVRESALLALLGERVREERKRQGRTVRALAEASGLSERFLVSLEGGSANVSVARLAEIARALETTAADLLSVDPGRGAGESKRALAEPAGIVALTGLRGAGKSSVGRQAASALALPFIELDQRIADRAGMGPGEIFDLHGAAYYRRLERDELERVLTEERGAVVATAGSLVTESATYERLLGATTVVWLRASAEDHFARVLAQGDERPMAERANAMRELRAILRARRALYERAHHVVDTSKLGLPRSIDRVVRITNDARRSAPGTRVSLRV